MCGIVGFTSFKEYRIDIRDTIEKMNTAIWHRGPDDQGIYIDHYAALGNRRLSIIDLSSGKQPIHNEDRTLWIVFNGEIYNFPELRDELLKKGHDFYTHTDTEVILHLYEEHGTDCVKKLNGMFAFAVWNVNERTLFSGAGSHRDQTVALHDIPRRTHLCLGNQSHAAASTRRKTVGS